MTQQRRFARVPLREVAISLGLQRAFFEENYFPKLSEAAVMAFEQQEGLKDWFCRRVRNDASDRNHTVKPASCPSQI